MSKARKDIGPRRGRGGLTRKQGQPGIYSVTGIWGDATLATAEKGRVVVEATIEGILRDIDDLRDASAPTSPSE
jgi:creatinine amidohydrolase/Fe(II)-dependent formamide hydrolase-like protein